MNEKVKANLPETPVDYRQRLMQMADAAAEKEKPDNKLISFKSGILSFNDQAAAGNKLECIILASVYENQFFPGPFDPNNPVSPDCWALGLDEDEMEPDPELVTEAQAEDCSDCPQNTWEKDERGKFKTKPCKNIRRLALIEASSLDNLKAAEIIFARLPVMSVPNWSKYVTTLRNVVQRPPAGVITVMSVVPDARSQFKVQFQFHGLIGDEYMEDLMALVDRAEDDIMFSVPKNEAPYRAAVPNPAKPASSKSKLTKTAS